MGLELHWRAVVLALFAQSVWPGEDGLAFALAAWCCGFCSIGRFMRRMFLQISGSSPVWSGSVRSTAIWSASIWKSFVRTAGAPASPSPAQSNPYTQPMQASGAYNGVANTASSPESQSPQPQRPQPQQPQYHAYQQQAYGPAAFATANVPPTFTAPVAPVAQAPTQPRRGRRKPAGPLLVLMMFGLTMIACALCVWCIMTYGVQGGQRGTEYTLQACAAFVGGICLVTGIVIVALGFAGRRTGGLHPLTWISVFMSLVMVMALAGYSLFSYRINTGIPSSYKGQCVGNDHHGSTASEMSEYEQGIVAQGDDYATDVLHIDLSDYAKNNGPHKVDLQDGTQGTTSCPTGTLNVVASSAQVVVTLPNGCWWAFGSDGNFYNITDFVGSSDGLTLDSGNIYVSLMGNDSTKSVVKKRALGTYDRSCGSYGDESGIEISMMRPIRKMAWIPAPIPLGPIPLQRRECR